MSKECKEWLKVSELAEIMGLSRVSVYNKLKQVDSKTLKPLHKVDRNVTYYNAKVLELLQPKAKEEVEKPIYKPQEAVKSDFTGEYIKSMQEQIEQLRKQLDVKDELIKSQSQQVSELIKSNQHSQFLLQEKDRELQEVKLLEQKERAVEEHEPGEAAETSYEENVKVEPGVTQGSEIVEEILEKRVETYQKEDVQPEVQPVKKRGLFSGFGGFGKKK